MSESLNASFCRVKQTWEKRLNQHLKDAKHARAKAAKRERIKPKPQKRWLLPSGIALFFVSLVYAAANFGGASNASQTLQATKTPLVTPANAGVHGSALQTNANFTPNQGDENNYSQSSNANEVVKNVSSVTTSKTFQYNNREQLVSMTEGAVTTTYLYDGRNEFWWKSHAVCLERR